MLIFANTISYEIFQWISMMYNNEQQGMKPKLFNF